MTEDLLTGEALQVFMGVGSRQSVYAAASESREHACPQCGGPLQRIPRKALDRLISVAWPVRRYRCENFLCEWEGNLRHRPKVDGVEFRTSETARPES